jgi:hypothetical protein
MRRGQKVANDIRKGLEREQRQERTAARQQRRNELASPRPKFKTGASPAPSI